MLASVPLFPKFVPEGAAMYHELRKRGTSATARGESLAVSGADKELVGQIAADIRQRRKPEPYKGKGIRYQGEQILRKAGKAGKVGGAK